MSDTPQPRGRAALIEKLRQRQLEKVGEVGISSEQTAEVSAPPPKPTGRAALLRKIQEAKQKSVGIKESPTEVPKPTQYTSTSEGEVTTKLENISITAKPKDPVIFKGTQGKSLTVSTNYIRLKVEKDGGVFVHEVRFNPNVDSKNMRYKMLNQHTDKLGMVKMFDGGSVLYLPKRLSTDMAQMECEMPDGDKVVMTVIYKCQSNSQCLHLYNVLFKKIMRVLMFSPMGKSYFDTNNKYLIPQHRLEVYPGFAISVDELEGGLLLCLDTQHRVLRSQNAYELLEELHASRTDNIKENYRNAVIGQVVLTRYNNKTYIVDDISWESSPLDTFESSVGTAISFKEYYKKQYNITILNDSQPMLIHRKSYKGRENTGKVEHLICLVPELCFLTGLTDVMRNDFKVMKDVGQYTRVTPSQRENAMKIFIKNVQNSPAAKQVLADWGMSLDLESLQLEGRILPSETLFFGNNQDFTLRNNGDWSRAAGENKAALPIDIFNWVVFHTQRDRQNTNKFVDLGIRLGNSMGCQISRPRVICLPDDKNESYVSAIKNHVVDGVQAAVFVCPTLRTDRYQVIKRICCNQIPVASQVIMSRTLSNDKKVRSISQKIMAQINCKLGGTLWSVRMPFRNWMIIGIDVYHSAKGSKTDSICAMVASLNESISRWFSLAVPQRGELSEYFKVLFSKALENYKRINGCYPIKIVIFRDGISEGQFDHCLRYEVQQFESTLKQFGLDIPICFVIVQKRINTKIYTVTNDGRVNPDPGTIVDHTITKRYIADFYLIPQSVRQGTVNPTHYIVLYDTCNLEADHIQRLAFKLCHLYYNWSGTIRVPAPCQYAHKLASLYGQHLNKPVLPDLADKLYYL